MRERKREILVHGNIMKNINGVVYEKTMETD